MGAFDFSEPGFNSAKKSSIYTTLLLYKQPASVYNLWLYGEHEFKGFMEYF